MTRTACHVSRLVPLLFLLAVMGFWPSAGRADDAPKVTVAFDPPLSRVLPGHDPVLMTVRLAKGAWEATEPLPIHVRVLTPAAHPLLSTDFPVVEGTVLLDQTFFTRTGEVRTSLVLPIRGTYVVEASVTPEQGKGEAVTTRVEAILRENPSKVRNALLLLLGVSIVGALFGFVLGREYKLGKLLVQGVLALAVTASAMDNVSWAHGSQHARNVNSEATATPVLGGGPHIVLASAQPKVGELTALRISWEGRDGVRTPRDYHLEIVRLEDGLKVVDAHLAAPAGVALWQSQLFDGTTYEARVTEGADETTASSPKNRATLVFDVEPVAPPARAVMKSMALLTGVLAFGMALSFRVTVRRGGSFPPRRVRNPA